MTTASELATATVHARAALAGNPSDGYEGAVVSVPVPAFAATATAGVAPAEVAGELELVAATRKRFGRRFGTTSVASVSIETTIPRSVGLAGSSAIVIATIHALAAHHDVALRPDEVAAMAHAVERQDLNIAGGWQDQIIQSHGRPMLMEFAPPMSQRVLAPTSLPLFVMWSHGAAEDSGVSHAELRSRAEATAPVMDKLATIARQAADALEANDGHTLKACMGETFDLRASIMPIAPAHRRMIDIARAAGTNANFAGSGGAVSGIMPKDPTALTDLIERECARPDAADLAITTWVPADLEPENV